MILCITTISSDRDLTVITHIRKSCFNVVRNINNTETMRDLAIFYVLEDARSGTNPFKIPEKKEEAKIRNRIKILMVEQEAKQQGEGRLRIKILPAISLVKTDILEKNQSFLTTGEDKP